jgi:hypothetical protein
VNLDEEVLAAIRQATRECGQPETVADRLIAWLGQMSRDELSAQKNSEYLINVRKTLEVASVGETL